MPIKIHPSLFMHPGKWLMSEIVAPTGRPIARIAAHMGVTRQALSNLLNGHADPSAEMALRFEKAFGLSADTLMRMQLNHDMAQARSHADDIRVERLDAAAGPYLPPAQRDGALSIAGAAAH